MFRFHLVYFILFLSLLAIEVLIAVFVHDSFVRPVVGDFLVVILMYCFCKSFVSNRDGLIAISVLLFAYIIEVLQYVKFITHIGLQHSKIANVVLGNTFQWSDMVAYTAGILLVQVIEGKNRKVKVEA